MAFGFGVLVGAVFGYILCAVLSSNDDGKV